MGIEPINDNISAYRGIDSNDTSANGSPPTGLPRPAEPPNGFESSVRGGREPRSAWGWMPVFGPFVALAKGEDFLGSVLPGVKLVVNMFSGSSNDSQGAGGADNSQNKPRAGGGVSVNGYQTGPAGGGAFIELSQDPAIKTRVMASTRKGLNVVNKAIDDLEQNHVWNSETAAYMGQIYGTKITSKESLQKLTDRLKSVRAAMEKTIESDGKNIYLELSNMKDSNTVAYAPLDKDGHVTGQLVLLRGGLDEMSDARLTRELIHEHAHLGADLEDHWYLNYDKDRGFYIRPRADGTVPDFDDQLALDNPDSLAHGAIVLANNPVATITNPVDDGNSDNDKQRYEF